MGVAFVSRYRVTALNFSPLYGSRNRPLREGKDGGEGGEGRESAQKDAESNVRRRLLIPWPAFDPLAIGSRLLPPLRCSPPLHM